MTNNKRVSGNKDFWRDMDSDTLKKIQMEKERKLFEETKMLKKIENEEILKRKGVLFSIKNFNILRDKKIFG